MSCAARGAWMSRVLRGRLGYEEEGASCAAPPAGQKHHRFRAASFRMGSPRPKNNTANAPPEGAKDFPTACGQVLLFANILAEE